MKNARFTLVVLVITLVFALTVTGCVEPKKDTWEEIESLDQVNGTWRGSFDDETIDFKVFYEEITGETWGDLQTALYGDDMKITTSVDITFIIDANAKSETDRIKTTITFSGGRIGEAIVWKVIESALTGILNATFNSTNHSITMIETDDDISIDLNDFDGMLINQNGKKLKIPAGLLDTDSPEIILEKQ